jgi:signal peptidase I
MRVERDNYWHSTPPPYYFGEFDDDHDHGAEGSHGSSRPNVAREVAETILLTLLIFFVVRAVVQNFKVEGDSMLPSLHSEQYLLVNKGLYFRYDANFLERISNPQTPPDMRYLFHGPQRGDIVVFEAWDEPRDFIKRVIAVEGEMVEVKKDQDPVGDPTRDCGECGVYVNGVKLNEPYIRQRPDYDYPPTLIAPGEIFVLGDNRRNSSDSHIKGPLPVDRIIGTAFVSYWPQNQWGLLPHPTYAEIEKP